MGSDSSGSACSRRRAETRTRIITDGGGSGLFDVTDRPVIKYEQGEDGPIVVRLNQAFEDTFDVTDDHRGDRLVSVPVPVRTAGTDGESSIYELVRRGGGGRLTVSCETTDGTRAFDIQIVETGQSGYVIFEETGADPVSRGRLDVLESVAHSLRNPLEVAGIYTDLAKESGELDHLDRVEVAHDRIETILTDARKLARKGTAIDEKESVDVAAVAEDAWETVETGGATLQVETPGTIDADESRLRELFENLFRNAVNHGVPDDGGAGGYPTVTVEGMPDGFAVADDGTGIPPAKRDDVLEIGYTTTEDGTGLGLAIVSEIARGHGWEITVTESQTGGARFEFIVSSDA